VPHVTNTISRLFLENIFHPSDFTEESEIAFAHALKIGLAAKANLNIFHVHPKRDDEEWTEFPGVRELLVRVCVMWIETKKAKFTSNYQG